MDRRTFPLWLVLAGGCTNESRAPGVFADQDQVAEQLAAELTDTWLVENRTTALRGVQDVVYEPVVVDTLGMAHVRLRQTDGDVPVFGGEAIVHLAPSGEVASMTDTFVREPVVDTTPNLSSEEAIGAAIHSHPGGVSVGEAELQVLRHDGTDHLTWRVQLEDLETEAPSRPVVFVDAHDGRPVWQYDNLQTARDRSSHSAGNRTMLPGALVRTEGGETSGNPAVDDAHDFAGLTWDYYWTEYGRDSYDDAGATITSTANFGTDYDNAFWSGTQMVYGDGGTWFHPLSGSVEVVGHELTHAVTQFSANLTYEGESGALNEATSDILGVSIDAWSRGWAEDEDTWKIGESIVKPALGEALRHMDDPTLDGMSIDHYGQYTPDLDVHLASGIANKAFYRMVQDPALDLEQAASVWYRALTVYMTPSTTFAGARTATMAAATDLFGAGSAAVAAVDAAWADVGVLD